jgi:hypothetical protein
MLTALLEGGVRQFYFYTLNDDATTASAFGRSRLFLENSPPPFHSPALSPSNSISLVWILAFISRRQGVREWTFDIDDEDVRFFFWGGLTSQLARRRALWGERIGSAEVKAVFYFKYLGRVRHFRKVLRGGGAAAAVGR